MTKSKGRLLSELAEAPKNEDYADVNALPNTGNKVGDQAFVEATDRLYIWNGSGWYNIALINTTPTWDSGGQPEGSYVLDADSPQTATTITLAASDPEGLPISYNYVTGGSMDSIATISQDSSVFTITPKTSTQSPDGGTGSITFRATDGINILPQVSSFTLSFITTVTNSKYTTLLATATDTSDNNNITDSSSNNHSITVNGDAHAGTFSPYRSGGYSTSIPNGDANNLVIADDASFDIYDGDYTVEAWLYPTFFNASQNHWVSKGGNTTREWSFTLNSTEITAYWTTGGTSSTDSTVTVSATNSINEWMHICIKKSGSTLTIYKNGVSLGTGTFTSIYNGSGTVKVGRLMDFTGISHSFNGYISDLRIVKGTAITPPSGGPTERLEAVTNTSLLTCHLPYIADGSTNDHSITVNGNTYTKPFSPYDYNEYSATDHGGSVYFDGSNDDLTITDHSAFDLSTGNWTVEFWWNPKSVNTNEGPMSVGYGSGSSPTGLKFAWENNKLYAFSMDGSTLQTGLYHDATAASLVNRWNHVAAVYNGTNTDLYLNGVASGRAQSTNFGENSSDDVRIGSVRRLSSIHYSECSISDVRIVKGTAVYSGNFTPPTGPLTTTGGTYPSTANVNTTITASNTSLLIKSTDASIIDKSQGTNLKLVGNATGSTTQAKFVGSKSMYFDGSGDYITTTIDGGLGSGDFTIDGWVYFTSFYDWICMVSNTRGSTGMNFGTDATGDFNFYDQVGTSAIKIQASNQFSVNTWYHFAVVRSNGVIKAYIDGIQVGSDYSQSVNYSATSFAIAETLGAPGETLTGYMQDVRITKGLARYTANFTPPTASLEG